MPRRFNLLNGVLLNGVRAFAIFDALVLLALVWLIATSDLFS